MGISMSRPDGKQLNIGVLKKDSPWVGKPFTQSNLNNYENEIEVIAVLREGHVIFPTTDNILKEGEQILIVSSPQSLEWIKAYLIPLSSYNTK